jgi:choline dehydrogenase
MPDRIEAEYVVVGSGAGGGTVAARLAERGHTVLVLEAGSDPGASGPDTFAEYRVPAFHPFATENADMRWDFFVRHYANDAQQQRDPKYQRTFNGRDADGIFYPRVGALGGCAAHNALIFVYPHDADWNELADLTGDPTWRSDRMRAYFELLENCHHRSWDRTLKALGLNPSRHGWNGWLQTERMVPDAAFQDRNLKTVLVDSARAALQSKFRLTKLTDEEGDPNDWRVIRDDTMGLRYTPLTTKDHERVGPRERLLEVQTAHKDRLTIRTGALATRVLFDDQNRAIGVEFLEGERLYRAHPQPGAGPGVVRQAFASREVILAGGAFNTPQLLMLSGVGDRQQLTRHGISTRVDLPGVGKNLQDRYEVAVVNRMSFDAWDTLRGATFTRHDPLYREWDEKRTGVYGTNGVLLSIVMRSGLDRPAPDLFCYALLAKFTGYAPGYSEDIRKHLNYLTWVVLKGHTNNTSGEVTLRSADPRDTPLVNFRYFDESNDAGGRDADAVVEGVKFVRTLTAGLKREGLIAAEEMPGDALQTDEQLKTFVRDNAWGHHASCTCPIGARDRGGVLSSDFKVHGTQGLRVVDASVFPRIPGLFIISAIYMVGEKAADVIDAEARGGAPSPAPPTPPPTYP